VAAKGKSGRVLPDIRNAKAGRDFALGDRYEAGIVLRGTEVKSIRAGKAQMADAFGRIDKGEAFLHNLHISEYEFGNINNHAPKRARKLLLKQREIPDSGRNRGGKSLVPARVFQGRAGEGRLASARARSRSTSATTSETRQRPRVARVLNAAVDRPSARDGCDQGSVPAHHASDLAPRVV
jgi:SsrA-binding protein